MIIAVDARPLSRPVTGIGRYTYNVLKHLIELDSSHIWHLYSDQPLTSDIPTAPNVHIKTGNVKTDIASTLFAQVIFSIWARRDNIDIFWSPRHHLPLFLPGRVKKIVTIHDIVWYRHPETMPKSRKWLEKLFMPPSLATADRIIAVSDFTKLELSEALGVRPEKITVTMLAPTPAPRTAPPSAAQTSELPHGLSKQSFYLFVGTLEPRKNLHNLLKAFSTFSKDYPDHILVIAGKDGWGKDSVARITTDLEISDKVKILGFVNDDLLHRLYQNCSALLMPSLYEGFGLPAIEALYYSKPVIATTNSAISPALSPLVINTTGHSAQDILDAMAQLEKQQYQTRHPLISHTWVDCAAKTLQLFIHSKTDQP